MDCYPTPVSNRFARKRQKDPEKWKRTLQKRLKYSAKSLPERACSHSTQSLQCASLTMPQLMPKKPGNVLVRGETFYRSDLAKSVNVCQRQKVIGMISPLAIPNVVPVNKNKLADVNKLLCKHFGTSWKDIPTLNFYKDVLYAQKQLMNVSQEEENYCEGGLGDDCDLRI